MTNLNNLAVVDPVQQRPEVAVKAKEVGTFFSTQEMDFTLLVMGFGIVAFFVFWLIARDARSTPLVLRLYVIMVLAIGTLIVVSSSYSTSQIAPVVGFFGTVAGYLLGKGERTDEQK
jgi:hydrogenase/urease accessory protein HupE